MSLFSLVDEHVGRNPVARAVALSGLRRAVCDFKLTMYFLADGTEQPTNLISASQVLAVAMRIRELQGSTEGVSVMRGAQSAILDRSKHHFRWRRIDAVPIDVALTAAQAAMESATARQVLDAWMFVRELEAQA